MPNRPVSKIIDKRFFLSVPRDTPVAVAAALMKHHDQGAVLVIEDGALAGICTERDIVFDVVAEARDPARTPVGAIMTRDPVAVRPDMPFGHALHLMFEGGFRHLPVIDAHGAVRGVVSARDALTLDVVRFKDELAQREALAELL